MTQDFCAQSFQVCAVRVTRLDATGTPLTGATDGYIAKAPIEAKMSPDNQAGVELTAENGCGTLCGYYKQPDQLKKYNVSLSLCDLDNELIELLTDNPVVTDGGETIGQTSKRVGACSNNIRNGVALELWSKRWNSCAPPTGADLYWHWFWPRAYLQTGDQDFKNDFMVIPIEGYLQENPNFGFGAWSDGAWPTGAGELEALWGVVKEEFFPEAVCGYTPVV